MSNLLSLFPLAELPPLNLVVHIGAGALAAPADYAALQASKLLLVEADPAAVARLQSTFARSTPQTRVLERLILPNSGPATLFKFNFPAINGIRPGGELNALYPNLRLLEELPLQGESFSAFLAALSLESDSPRLLILDVQGQELALLESLSPELTERFEWILLRGGASEWQEGANALAASAAFLEGRFFESVATENHTDPAWPIHLLRHNRRHAALQRELDSRARQLIEKAAEIYGQSERISRLEPQLAQAQAESHSLHQELYAAREITAALGHNSTTTSTQLENAQAQIRALEARQVELDDELGAKKTLIQALTKGRAQQDQLFAELAAERDVLRESLAAAQLRITECEAQLAAKDTRAALSDAEFQKIEGQMDIIKAMVFREHGR